MIKNFKTTLTSDDIKNGATGIFPVPKEVLPLAAAGKVHNFLGVTIKNVPGGAVDYTGGIEMRFKTDVRDKVFIVGSGFQNKAAYELVANKNADIQSIFSTVAAILVTTQDQAIDGDFAIEIIVCFEERNLVAAS